MANATTVKAKKSKTGKTKFQAQVWHKGVFYASKTFDIESLARAYKEKTLLDIVRGDLQSAAVRAEARVVDAALHRPMTHWADLYAQKNLHGGSRAYDYTLVGKLLADKTLKDFDGRAGAQLIEKLTEVWRLDRRPRSARPRPENALPIDPLKPNTVRLRLTALMRLIRFAKASLPDTVAFKMPAMDELFEFALPPAHSQPRKRMTEDAELARLLEHFGSESDQAHFLRVIDETGCRLGEVRLCKGSDVNFFTVAGTVVGGYLTLTKHKTSDDVGTREVPLSLFAAQILHDRKLRHGDGALFPGLGTKDRLCKAFEAACSSLGIKNLLIKDGRRAFINRNKGGIGVMDMVKVVGESTLLCDKDATPSERNVQEAVGHTNISTTGAYSQPRLAELAQIFTKTSRWWRVAALLQPPSKSAAEIETIDVSALKRALTDTLAMLARAGVTN